MSLRQGGDYLFWVQLAGQGNVACVNKNLSYFRIHGGSVTACNGSSSIGPMEDKRIFDYIDSHYHLSWFHKQIVYAQRYRWYCWEPDEIKQEALALWGMPERSETVDNVLLWLVAKARLHFGVLL